MSKSKSFGGIPLRMSWYTGNFPGSNPAPSQRPSRQPHNSSSGPTPTASNFQQPVINADGTGGRIELKLAPVQQDSKVMVGPRGCGGGWGDDYGKDEGVGGGGAWNNNITGWGKGDHGNRDGGESGLLLQVKLSELFCAAWNRSTSSKHLAEVSSSFFWSVTLWI